MNDSNPTLEQTNSPLLTDLLTMNPDVNETKWMTNITLRNMLPFAPDPLLLNSMDPQATWKTFDPHIKRNTPPKNISKTDCRQQQQGAPTIQPPTAYSETK